MTLSFATLLNWIEGRLPAEEAGRVAAAVEQANAETRDMVAWLRAFQGLSAETVLDAPPAHVRRALRRRFKQRAAVVPAGKKPDFLSGVIKAVLSFDSAGAPAPAGVRSAITQGQERQLVYTSDLADLALNVRRRPDQRLDLLGQLLPLAEDDPIFYSVQLLQGEEEAGLTMTDELGEFAFEEILPGTYKLVLSCNTAEIALPSVNLRA